MDESVEVSSFSDWGRLLGAFSSVGESGISIGVSELVPPSFDFELVFDFELDLLAEIPNRRELVRGNGAGQRERETRHR